MQRAAHRVLPLLVVLAAACGGAKATPAAAPRAQMASAKTLDSLWAVAGKSLRERKWPRAIIQFERMMLVLPFGDPRLPAAHYYLGEAYLGDGSNLLAVREFRQVADLYPGDSLAPHALVRAGDAYSALWRRPELDPTDGQSALGVYQEVLTRYPSAPAAEVARTAIAGVEEKMAIKDLRNAEYYLKYKAYDSALTYLRSIVTRFPRAQVMPQVLARLISTYRTLGYVEDVQEICGYFRTNFATAPQLKSSCPLPATPGTPPGE